MKNEVKMELPMSDIPLWVGGGGHPAHSVGYVEEPLRNTLHCLGYCRRFHRNDRPNHVVRGMPNAVAT